jgi:hypothetical protein
MLAGKPPDGETDLGRIQLALPKTRRRATAVSAVYLVDHCEIFKVYFDNSTACSQLRRRNATHWQRNMMPDLTAN